MSSSTFDTTLIRPGVRWYHGQNCKKIKISDFLTDFTVSTVDNNAEPMQPLTEDSINSFEDCVLMGVLLNVIHGSTSSAASKSLSGSQYGSNFNAAAGTKRAKNNNAAPYDRMFIFGDVSDPPNCFVVMCETARESRMLTEHSINEVAVGRVFCLLEPRKTDKFIGNGDLPIVSLTVPLVPLCMEDKVKVLPAALSAPGDVGKQMFFVYHNLPIQLSYFYIATDDVSCAGLLCDRQHRLKQNTSCACLHNGKANKPIVADFNVQFRSGLANGRFENIVVKRCRSIRTTVLFFDDFLSFQQLSREETIQRTMIVRSKVRKMIKAVNSNGGWTLVGWCKKGEVSDAANRFEKIESEDVTYHISLLQPTISSDNDNLDKIKTTETGLMNCNESNSAGNNGNGANDENGDDGDNSNNVDHNTSDTQRNRADNEVASVCDGSDGGGGSGGGSGGGGGSENDVAGVGVNSNAGVGAGTGAGADSNFESAGAYASLAGNAGSVSGVGADIGTGNKSHNSGNGGRGSGGKKRGGRGNSRKKKSIDV